MEQVFASSELILLPAVQRASLDQLLPPVTNGAELISKLYISEEEAVSNKFAEEDD